MIHTTRLEESYKQRLWQGKDCFSSKLQIICSKGSAAPNGSLYFPGKAVLWTMDPAPCYVLELLKLLTEFSFNLLLKIKLSFFWNLFISAPVAALSTWTGKCTREFIAWAGVPSKMEVFWHFY